MGSDPDKEETEEMKLDSEIDYNWIMILQVQRGRDKKLENIATY